MSLERMYNVEIIRLNLLGKKEVTTVQIKQPVLQEKPIQEVVVTKPTLPPQVVETMVGPFSIRTIDHDVIVEQIDYHVHLRNIEWLDDGMYTFADTIISRPQVWEVEKRLLLTYRGKPCDCTDKMIGAFAQARMTVNRRLIDACLFPVQNQILEIERKLKNY